MTTSTGTRDVYVVTQRNWNISVNSSLHTIVQIDLKEISNDILDKLKDARVKDNQKPVYILVANDSAAVISDALKIRQLDHFNPLLIFCESLSGCIDEVEDTVYNAYFIAETVSEVYAFYEVCMFCNSGEDELMLINLWTPSLGFKNKFVLPVSFKNRFYGRTIYTGCRKWSRYGYYDEQPVELLSEILDFKNAVLIGQTRLQMVLDGKADLYGCGMRRSSKVRQELTISYMHRVSGGLHIISRYPPRGNNAFAFLQPYPYYVWIMTLLGIAGSAFLVWILLKTNGQIRSFHGCIWLTAALITWVPLSKPSVTICIFLTLYMTMSITIITAFRGSMTSFLVNPSYLYPPMDSLEQLRNSDMKILVRRDSELAYLEEVALQHKVEFARGSDSKAFSSKQTYQMILDNPQTYVRISSGFEIALKFVKNNFTLQNWENKKRIFISLSRFSKIFL